MPVPNASGSTRTTRSNSSPFDSSGVSDWTRDGALNVGSPMTQAIPSACAASQVPRIEPRSEVDPWTTGTSLVRSDEQHAAPAVTEARVGVQEVGGTVQRDDGLPRARTAVDDESAAGSRADDGVLVGLDGAEDVSHSARPATAHAGDEGGLVVERGVPLEALGG